MTKKLTVDTFKTKTFDGYPVELISAVEHDNATILLPGLIKARLRAALLTRQAFAIFNSASVLTYSELREKLDI